MKEGGDKQAQVHTEQRTESTIRLPTVNLHVIRMHHSGGSHRTGG